jgi:hypothetical protein
MGATLLCVEPDGGCNRRISLCVARNEGNALGLDSYRLSEFILDVDFWRFCVSKAGKSLRRCSLIIKIYSTKFAYQVTLATDYTRKFNK